MSDARTITGGTTLRYGDEFAFHLIRLPSYLIGLVPVLTLVVTVCWWWALPGEARAAISELPGGDPLVYWLSDIGDLLLAMIGFCLFWIFLGAYLQFRRLGPEHWSLSYAASAEALTTRDAAGVELTLPWSNAARMRVTGRLLLVQYRWGLWRYVPLRAFAAEDRGLLLAYARRESSFDAV